MGNKDILPPYRLDGGYPVYIGPGLGLEPLHGGLHVRFQLGWRDFALDQKFELSVGDIA